jgi:hypothetical protein
MTKGIGKPVNGGSNEFRGASSEQSTEKNRKEGRPDPSPALSTPSRCRHLPRRAHETFKLRPRRTRKVQAERSVRHGSMMPCRLVVLRHVGVAIPRGVLRRSSREGSRTKGWGRSRRCRRSWSCSCWSWSWGELKKFGEYRSFIHASRPRPWVGPNLVLGSSEKVHMQ